MPQIRFEYASLHLKLFGFRDLDWKCAQLVENDFPEISQWKFRSLDGQAKFDLDINCVKSCGTYVLSIYAPFWMINKTGKLLNYRESSGDVQNVIHHYPVDHEIPMMFSFTKRFLGKRKASVRVGSER